MRLAVTGEVVPQGRPLSAMEAGRLTASLRSVARDLGWIPEGSDTAPKRRRFTIVDQRALARVIQQLCDEWPEEPYKERVLGISQSSLSRHRRGAQKKIDSDTFDSLMRAIFKAARAASRRREVTPRYREMVESLNGAVLTAQQRERIGARRAWCRDWIVRTFEHNGTLYSRDRGGVRRVDAADLPRPEDLHDSPHEVIQEPRGAARWKHYVSVRRSVLKTTFAGKALREFDRWLASNCEDADRAEIARIRVLAPLLDAYDSAFAEPSVEELGDDLTEFVRAGIDREKILLGAIERRATPLP